MNSKEFKQSILKEINPEYSLEGLMLKLKLLYYGHLMQRADSVENTLMLGKLDGIVMTLPPATSMWRAWLPIITLLLF